MAQTPSGGPYSDLKLLSLTFAALLGVCALPALASPPAQDEALEERLDEYIQLFPEADEDRIAHLDAIIQDLDEQTPSATRVRALGYRALEAQNAGEEDKTRTLKEELIQLAETSSHTDVQAEARAFQIELLWRMDEEELALVQVPQLEAMLPTVYSPRVRYYAHNLTGRLLSTHSQHEEALEHFLHAYDAAQETEDGRTLVRRQFLNYNIAQLQSDLRNYEQALNTVQRGISTALNNDLDDQLPQLYLLKGYIFAQKEDREAAVEAHNEAIRWAEELNQPGIVLTSLNNIGSSQIQMERYEEATATLEQAYEQALELGDEEMQFLLEFNLAYLDIMQGAGSEAVDAMEEAKAGLESFYTDSDMADLLGYLATAYREAGRLEDAIDTLLEQRDLNDELFQSERDRRLNELQTRYETREQATEIELLEQRNQLQEQVIQNNRLQQRITLLFSIVVVLSLILLWLAYRSARRANKKLTVVNRELSYQSVHDSLTGLLNRRSFQKEMEKRGRSGAERRAQPYPDALLLLDLDFFKRINDRYGHSGGDAVLQELARRLKAISRDSDMVIRWGGEEILLFLRNMDPATLPDYVARVLKTIGDKPVVFEDKQIPVTATGGFIQLPLEDIPETELDWERALHIADMALYMGKTHGRNQAIGVLGLNRPYEEIRDILSDDLADAVEQGLVKYITLPAGPDRSN